MEFRIDVERGEDASIEHDTTQSVRLLFVLIIVSVISQFGHEVQYAIYTKFSMQPGSNF